MKKHNFDEVNIDSSSGLYFTVGQPVPPKVQLRRPMEAAPKKAMNQKFDAG